MTPKSQDPDRFASASIRGYTPLLLACFFDSLALPVCCPCPPTTTMDALLNAQDRLFYATFPDAAAARRDPAQSEAIQAAHLMQFAEARLASGDEDPLLGLGASGGHGAVGYGEYAYPDAQWYRPPQSHVQAQDPCPPQQQQYPVSDNTRPPLSLALPAVSAYGHGHGHPLETHTPITPFTPPAKTARRASASATSPTSATGSGKPAGSVRQRKSSTRDKDKNGDKDRKPPLACLFCRGRKIACGPPMKEPGLPQDACNQCQRRGLTCEYPIESRRGMRRKGTAPDSSKDDAGKAGSSSGSGSASTSGAAGGDDTLTDDDADDEQEQQRSAKARRLNPELDVHDEDDDIVSVKREDDEHDNADADIDDDHEHDLHDLLDLDMPFVDEPKLEPKPFVFGSDDPSQAMPAFAFGNPAEPARPHVHSLSLALPLMNMGMGMGSLFSPGPASAISPTSTSTMSSSAGTLFSPAALSPAAALGAGVALGTGLGSVSASRVGSRVGSLAGSAVPTPTMTPVPIMGSLPQLEKTRDPRVRSA
uniref:Zn(2)-C6 fungal-type domain-containing protein n=1 Tax=Mycena chlorophos TaxID=658473 RepID=A0ABQ0M3C1_MYCCL|nr:predicted protein [Mycena chlorophos]